MSTEQQSVSAGPAGPIQAASDALREILADTRKSVERRRELLDMLLYQRPDTAMRLAVALELVFWHDLAEGIQAMVVREVAGQREA